LGVRYEQLRTVCQEPVRHRNDVAGLLYGDRASLPITKLFVDRGLTPDYASIGFFVCGLAGSALAVGSGWWALAGALLLVLYYVLDCVDGEVARFQNVVDVKWGYYDRLFHMVVKPLTFLGVGAGTYLESGNPWLWVAAASAAFSTLWLKMFLEYPGILFLETVLAEGRGTSAAESPDQPPAGLRGQGFELGFDRTTLRALMTNFDVGLLFLVAAAALDLFGPSLRLPGAPSWRTLWLGYYGVVLLVDWLDYVRSYLRRGHFTTEMRRLSLLAHHFTAPRKPAADEERESA